MKIIMVTMGLDIGGAETHITELSKELKRRGHDLAIVSGGGVYVKEIEEVGIRHYTVKMSSKNPVSMYSAVKQLKSIFISEKPDIVHAHARIPAFLTGIAHKLLGKKCPFVFVTTVHGAFSTAFPLKLLTNWGDMSLAVSEDLKKYLTDNYGVKDENIRVSINGIDMNKFSPDTDGKKVAAELGLSPDSKKIVCVTRLDPRVCSHAGRIMDIMPEIDKAVPGTEYVLVGNGEAYETLLEKSKEVNKALGRRAVILTGGRTDVNEILACADVCVGVSRAILEAMATEKKCVVVGEWGYIGILDENSLETARGCNFTCRGCDKVANAKMASDIVKLLTCADDEGKRIASFGKSVVEKYYSAAKMADDNENFYHTARKRFGGDAAILGYYGFHNCGDDALLGAIIGDLRKISPDFGITVLSNNPEEHAAQYDVNTAFRFSFKQVLRALKKSKLFILGGGSLVQDVTSSKSLWYYLCCARLAKLVGIPVMLYANGIGPITKKGSRRIVKSALNKVDCITLRDNDSMKTLAEAGVTKPEITVTADPAFSFSEADTEAARKLLEKYGVKGKYICLSVRSLVGKNEKDNSFTEGFAALADYISEKHGLTPVFPAMQYSKDKKESLGVLAKMKTHGVFIDEELDSNAVLGLITLSEAVVAVRLHMLIFSALLGKPAFGIEYDPKVRSFADLMGNRFCISPTALSDGSFKHIFDEFMSAGGEISDSLQNKLPELKKRAFRNAEIAVELAKKQTERD